MFAAIASAYADDRRRRVVEACGYCGERKTVADRTWQQWQCATCSSWNDRRDA